MTGEQNLRIDERDDFDAWVGCAAEVDVLSHRLRGVFMGWGTGWVGELKLLSNYRQVFRMVQTREEIPGAGQAEGEDISLFPKGFNWGLNGPAGDTTSKTYCVAVRKTQGVNRDNSDFQQDNFDHKIRVARFYTDIFYFEYPRRDFLARLPGVPLAQLLELEPRVLQFAVRLPDAQQVADAQEHL